MDVKCPVCKKQRNSSMKVARHIFGTGDKKPQRLGEFPGRFVYESAHPAGHGGREPRIHDSGGNCGESTGNGVNPHHKFLSKRPKTFLRSSASPFLPAQHRSRKSTSWSLQFRLRPSIQGTPLDTADASKESGKGGEEPSFEGDSFDETPGDANRLFTKDFILAALANLSNAFGMQMLVATLPLYVINLGGSQTDAGLVSGALAFTALLFRPLMGYLTDAWRRRPLVLMGTACYGLASIVYLAVQLNPLFVAWAVSCTVLG